jgi:hypothetical protein
MKKEKSAKKVTDAELWQLRALDAQQGKLRVEVQLLQQQGMEVQKEMEKFVESLRKKYGEAQVMPDGTLVYNSSRPIPGVPGKPDVPIPPTEEPEDEEEDEEE